MPEQDPAATTTLIGQVDAVHGPVVDICTRYLPPLNQALMVRDHREPVLLEVFQHLNPSRIRAIALHSTAGLARGMPVFDTGAPLHVPVAPTAWDACSTSLVSLWTRCPPSQAATTAIFWRSHPR